MSRLTEFIKNLFKKADKNLRIYKDVRPYKTFPSLSSSGPKEHKKETL